MAQLVFSNDWFQRWTRETWERMFPVMKPSRVLEIGCYEGASTCCAIQLVASFRPLEIHCIDHWEGGIDHHDLKVDMGAVETRFRQNVESLRSDMPHEVRLEVHKGRSDLELAKLLVEGKENYFDFIYVDGSHQAADVLADAVLAFKLLRVGGFMGFDDYLWAEDLPYGRDPVRSPKMAIDAFTAVNCRKFDFMDAPCRQVYILKTAE